MNLNTTREEFDLIIKIVERIEQAAGPDLYEDRLTACMDISAVHCNGNPLDLNAMLLGSTEDFLHDVYGIYRHVDRRTGELRDCFSPRFSQRNS